MSRVRLLIKKIHLLIISTIPIPIDIACTYSDGIQLNKAPKVGCVISITHEDKPRRIRFDTIDTDKSEAHRIARSRSQATEGVV